MSKEECVKGLKYLSIAYRTEGYDKDESSIYYEFLCKYEYEIYKKAIKNIIKKSKYLPKLNELIDECENCKEQVKYEMLEFMKQKGYFKSIIEYEKACSFVERGIVPEWLHNDIIKYYKIMKQDKIEYKNNILLENSK